VMKSSTSSSCAALSVKVATFLSVIGGAVAGPVVTGEAQEFAVRDSAVPARRAGVVEIVVSTPAFDSFGANAEFPGELADCYDQPRLGELPLPTHSRRSRSFLEAGASCFQDALCRNQGGSRRERSLHRRFFGVTHS
jgi:hypothetical protein